MCLIRDIGPFRYEIFGDVSESGRWVGHDRFLPSFLLSDERVNVLWFHGKGQSTGESGPYICWV